VPDAFFYGDETPIAALATTPALSALSVIRLSGQFSLGLLENVFSRPAALRKAAGNTVIYGWMIEIEAGGAAERSGGTPVRAAALPSPTAGRRLDEVLVSVYRAPKSYTGEDGADIVCHGGFKTARAIMAALLDAGFRDALPGEFTFRAFINGKLDLTRAEAVMEIVGAKSDEGLDQALGRLCGILESEITAIKDTLVHALAETELNLDYSEIDGVDSGSGLPARSEVENALIKLDALAGHYARDKLSREGALVVIAGKPNAGKSSLFNLLVREERSIVTGTPGTTRDWIEGWISLGGIPVRLVDTAGLREASGEIEKIGIERSRELLKAADLTLYLLDGMNFCEGDINIDGLFPETARRAGTSDNGMPCNDTSGAGTSGAAIFIWNKADIAPPPEKSNFLPVSAKTGAGVRELCGRIEERLGALSGTRRPPSAGLGTERQKKLIDTAREALRAVLSMSDAGEPLDLAAPVLREAVDALGMITGEVSTDDILEKMFSQFCIGK
jgi:tRNA modification GTPase